MADPSVQPTWSYSSAPQARSMRSRLPGETESAAVRNLVTEQPRRGRSRCVRRAGRAASRSLPCRPIPWASKCGSARAASPMACCCRRRTMPSQFRVPRRSWRRDDRRGECPSETRCERRRHGYNRRLAITGEIPPCRKPGLARPGIEQRSPGSPARAPVLHDVASPGDAKIFQKAFGGDVAQLVLG